MWLSYWPARLHRLAESFPGLPKRLRIRAQDFITKYGEWKKDEGLRRRMKHSNWKRHDDKDDKGDRKKNRK